MDVYNKYKKKRNGTLVKDSARLLILCYFIDEDGFRSYEGAGLDTPSVILSLLTSG